MWSLFRYLVSPSFIYVWLIAPWLVLRRSFWLAVVPMGLIFGFFGGLAAGLQGYYGLAFVALVFACLLWEWRVRDWARGSRVQLAMFVWLFAIASLRGWSAPVYSHPSELSVRTLVEARNAMGALPGIGVVSSRILPGSGTFKIWSDRVYSRSGDSFEPPEVVDWVLYPRAESKIPESFEFDYTEFRHWRDRAVKSGEWHRESTGPELEKLVRVSTMGAVE